MFFGFLIYGQNEALDAARSFVQKDNYASALEALKECPSNDCNFLKADLYQRTGQNKHAKPLLDSLLLDSTYKLAAHRILAKIFEAELNPPKAIKHYTALVNNDSSNALYHRKLGLLYLKSGYTLEAEKYYNEAHRLNPKDIVTLNALAELYFATSRIELADSLSNKSLDLDPENIKVQLINSKIAYKLKDYPKVAQQLRWVKGRIDLDEYFNKIYGFSLVKVDSFDRAIHTLHQILLNNPNAESVHYYLGIAYENLDEMEDAKFHFGRALETGISKQTALYHNKLATLAEEEKDWPLAIKHYKKSLDYKTDPENYFMLALATDNYYKDKSTCVRYYTKYLNTDHQNKEWKKYALERKNYLKEIAFLKKTKN